METIILIIAVLTCFYLTFIFLELIIGFKLIQNLNNIQSIEKSKAPFISIIFSALNEEENIAAALNSLLKLNYPNFEIIAINDRSTDKTPAILNHYQNEYPAQLKVLHINELPKGWLGKNHALHQGAQISRGEWLLFTDADVNMSAETLNKTIEFVTSNKIDHLTIQEHYLTNNFWLNLFYLNLYLIYNLAFTPWRISSRFSKKSLGLGAFNLVRKDCYQSLGGHTAIALECLDDLMLGKIVKKNGFKQATVNGRDFIKREWYKNFHALVSGWNKNAFGFFNYKIIPCSIMMSLTFLIFVWPFFSLFIMTDTIFWINFLNVLLTLSIYIFIANYYKTKKGYAFLYPLSILMLFYTMIKSAIFIHKNKGIIWRGTYYSLKELKNKNSPV